MTAQKIIQMHINNLQWHAQKNSREQEEVDRQFYRAAGAIEALHRYGAITQEQAEEAMNLAIEYRTTKR